MNSTSNEIKALAFIFLVSSPLCRPATTFLPPATTSFLPCQFSTFHPTTPVHYLTTFQLSTFHPTTPVHYLTTFRLHPTLSHQTGSSFLPPLILASAC